MHANNSKSDSLDTGSLCRFLIAAAFGTIVEQYDLNCGTRAVVFSTQFFSTAPPNVAGNNLVWLLSQSVKAITLPTHWLSTNPFW